MRARGAGTGGGYEISIDHIGYSRGDGAPFSLVEALNEVRGVAGAAIWRIGPDGSLNPVVDRAGSEAAVVHAPTGRVITRRRAHHHRRHYTVTVSFHDGTSSRSYAFSSTAGEAAQAVLARKRVPFSSVTQVLVQPS